MQVTTDNDTLDTAFLIVACLSLLSMTEPYSLLKDIHSPADLRRLPESDLAQVAHELRQFLIQSVSQSGGHFAAGLGSVELATALHYLYDTPGDRIVWDVGHQGYPHKILTGRRDSIHTVRQWDGISPFPKRSESPYDTFGVGHAGTAIGAAVGMAEGAKCLGSQRRVVAVVGDGGLTCGMAFEALNHAGGLNTSLLVILNDNEMSISPSVGALTQRLARILSGRMYTSIKTSGKKLLNYMPPMLEFARRTEEHVKGLIIPGTLFEEFGFNYLGPIDGHDLSALLSTIRNLQQLDGPQLLHISTRKGKGYPAAEKDPVKYHGISAPFDPKVGIVPTPSPKAGPTYSQVFGDWLCDMAAIDQRLVGITPAMREGSKMERFEAEYPDRYFDVAIAEQHSVTFAAGLACEGLKPVVAIYSTFLQRAYDQLIHDVVLQQLPVVFALDRAGLVGGDGPTHNGAYDISFLRCLPEIVIMTPADENETRQMLYTAYQLNQVCAVRYPRGTGPGVAVESKMRSIPIGRGVSVRDGRSIALLNFGPLLQEVMTVAEELNATVANMRYVKPLDEALVLSLAAGHDRLVTVEENARIGGAGAAVLECLAAHNVLRRVLVHGIPDRPIPHGSRNDMLRDAGLDRAGILAAIQRFVNDESRRVVQ